MRLQLIILYLIFTFSNRGESQLIYFSSLEDFGLMNLDSNTVRIGTFNLLTCEREILFIDTIINGDDPFLEWTDLALCPDGRLFGMGEDGVYEFNLSEGSYIKIFNPFPPVRYFSKGLFCTKDSVLVFGERDVGSYNLQNGDLIFHGRLPNNKSIWGNIFQLSTGLFASGGNNLVELNLADIVNSRVVCTFPGGNDGFIAIFEIAAMCDSSLMLALDAFGNIFHIDTMSCSLNLYCKLPLGELEGLQGTSATYMFMPPPPCAIHIDLDSLDELALGIDVRDTVACFLPGEFLFAELNLSSGRPWDSLYAWIETGPPGISLSAMDSGDATVIGSNSTQLRFYANNQSSLDDFRNSLYNIQLTGAVPTGYSEVIIGFRLFADHLRSDTAYAYITLAGRTRFAGLDGDLLALCPDASPVFLDELLSIDASIGGDWKPSTSSIGFFNPSIDAPGAYQYIVQDPNCGPDSAAFEIQRYNLDQLQLGPDSKLCPGDTLTLAVAVHNGSSVLWSTGETSASITVDVPQLLFVDVIDENGCKLSDTIEITTDIACLSDKLYIPNIFSPNADGINDLFSIQPSGAIYQIQCTIFDRWGNAIFHQHGAEIHWDGNAHDDKPVNPGVYAYRVIVQVGTESFLRQGDITVIR